MPKIYTRTGDSGETGLVSGRVSKGDRLIEAIGQLDTLNAHVGYLIDLIKTTIFGRPKIFAQQLILLEIAQNLIFTLGSQLADVEDKYKIEPLKKSDITDLEDAIDKMTEELPKLTNFILPGGHPIISWAHVVRTTCRSAERACVQLEHQPLLLISYLNRLSDYLFTLARYIGKCLNIKEVIWKSERNSTI